MPPSTASQPHCHPTSTGFGRTWSSTAEAGSTPQSSCTTAAVSAWCARALALRRRSLYDRLRAIAEYDYTRRPDTVLVLVPSVWEERLKTRFCENRNLRDSYIAVESRDALERRDLRLWCCTSWVIGSRFFTLEGVVSRASPGGGPLRQINDSCSPVKSQKLRVHSYIDDTDALTVPSNSPKIPLHPAHCVGNNVVSKGAWASSPHSRQRT